MIFGLLFLTLLNNLLLLDGTRIAFGSCFNPDDGDKIWKLIGKFEPNHLVLHGDLFYADGNPGQSRRKATIDKIRSEYVKVSEAFYWKQLRKNIKFLSMTFDDHDYGMNNGDRTFVFRNESQDEFWNFVGCAKDVNRKSGVFNSQIINDKGLSYKMVMLDTRSNKTPKRGANGDFLGEEQWEWLEHELLDDPANDQLDVVFIGSGIQVLPEGKPVEETWSEFPDARKRIINLISKASMRLNVILLSGDIHSAEVSVANCTAVIDSENDSRSPDATIDFSVIELTSSGLSHTFTSIANGTEEGGGHDEHVGTAEGEGRDVGIQVRSRGYLSELIFAAYQLFYPALHRPQRWQDFYDGINFGLIDIATDADIDWHKTKLIENRNSFGVDSGRYAVLSVVNHVGEVVISRAIPLKAFAKERKDNTGNSVHRAKCVPVRGYLTLWQELKHRAVLSLILLLGCVLPILAIIWFVGVSVWYIFVGKELARRERIERVFQERKLKEQ